MVGLYPTGQPGEIFIKMAKEGSTVSGLMDAFATSISLALQHGVPLRVLCEKFAHTRFEPSGWTGNEQIGYAKSLMDYIFRWLNLRFLSGEQLTLFAGLAPQAVPLPETPTILPETEPDASEHNQLSRLAEEMAKRNYTGMGSTSAPGGSIPLRNEQYRTAFIYRAARRRCRIAVCSTPQKRCAVCTRWAMPRAAPPAEPSWSATEAATAA